MVFGRRNKDVVDLDGVLEAGDPFREKKRRWGNEVYRKLLRYVDHYTAGEVTRAVLLNAFETSQRIVGQTTRPAQEGLGGFVLPPIFVPPWPGPTSRDRDTRGSEGTVVETKIEVALRPNIQGLVESEDSVAEELHLGPRHRWVYPFAVVKLLLIAWGKRAERKVGPREAVIIWTEARLGEGRLDPEKAFEMAFARYGEGLPRL